MLAKTKNGSAGFAVEETAEEEEDKEYLGLREAAQPTFWETQGRITRGFRR